jgi:hypothetical protein
MINRISCIILLALLVSACGVNATVNTEADKVASIAAEIVAFDLPTGYSPEFSASLSGYKMVSYNPGDGHSHLFFIQSEKDSDGDKLAKMISQIVPGEYEPQTRMTISETRLVTIRGQEVTMVISDGVTSEGETYRQVMIAFEGNGGPALVMLSEPVARWNQEQVDAFIASIH